MAALNMSLRKVLSRLGIGFVGNRAQLTDQANDPPLTDDQVFLNSIAHLSPDAQQQRIQRRNWYKRMAQRQGIMETEQKGYDHWGADSRT
jgi:hypothetical protein